MDKEFIQYLFFVVIFIKCARLNRVIADFYVDIMALLYLITTEEAWVRFNKTRLLYRWSSQLLQCEELRSKFLATWQKNDFHKMMY